MAEDEDFADFLRRIRAGDAVAAEELVRRYEPLIRREVRLTLQDPSLGRLVDSDDICQSVLASFFCRAASGQYELGQPAQLLALLIRMARNKVACAARRHHAQRRNRARVVTEAVDQIDPAAAAQTPSRIVAARDLLEHIRQRLTTDERCVVDLRDQGEEWGAIATALGGTSDGRRMQLTRALDRVLREMGIEEDPL
jgi:DNA-directed RNA polymerase specialized sigma24 family protein